MRHFCSQNAVLIQQVAIKELAIKMLDEKDILNLKVKPQVRDIKVYQQIFSKEKPCNKKY